MEHDQIVAQVMHDAVVELLLGPMTQIDKDASPTIIQIRRIAPLCHCGEQTNAAEASKHTSN
jgi:hypothetical protein